MGYVLSLLFFGIFYLLTVYITNKEKESTDTGNEETEEKTIIQYEEILVGTSFSMSDDEYLVLYYDQSDETLSRNLSDQVSAYRGKEDALKIYQVDLSNAFNQPYVTKGEPNRNPVSVSDLKFNGPTLIKISHGNVLDYVDGEDRILEYLA